MARSGGEQEGVAIAPTLKIVLAALALLAVAFLLATDRDSWFRLRPASGTAAALAQASDKPAPAP